MGSLREHVCKTLRDLRGVFCSQSARRRLRTSRAHVLAWRTPRIARFFFLCAGDVMAARVVGIRQEGVNPCRMVPSMRDEVHGSCMTSRARSNVRGCALPCKVRELRVAALERILNLKGIDLERKKQTSLSGKHDFLGQG